MLLKRDPNQLLLLSVGDLSALISLNDPDQLHLKPPPYGSGALFKLSSEVFSFCQACVGKVLAFSLATVLFGPAELDFSVWADLLVQILSHVHDIAL